MNAHLRARLCWAFDWFLFLVALVASVPILIGVAKVVVRAMTETP